MKKSLLLLVALFSSSLVWGRATQTQAMLNVREVDGTPSNYPYQFKVPNGSLTDGSDGTMTLSFSGSSLVVSTGTLQSGTTIYVSSGTIVTFYSSTATITNLIGTTTNDSAAVGNYGEYISSVVANVSVPNASATGDLASIPLTAGDWDVTGTVTFEASGIWTSCLIGITPNSGASNTGLVEGSTALYLSKVAAADPQESLSLPAVRISISGTTPYYLKFAGTFSTGALAAYGRISARRVR